MNGVSQREIAARFTQWLLESIPPGTAGTHSLSKLTYFGYTVYQEIWCSVFKLSAIKKQFVKLHRATCFKKVNDPNASIFFPFG